MQVNQGSYLSAYAVNIFGVACEMNKTGSSSGQELGLGKFQGVGWGGGVGL